MSNEKMIISLMFVMSAILFIVFVVGLNMIIGRKPPSRQDKERRARYLKWEIERLEREHIAEDPLLPNENLSQALDRINRSHNRAFDLEHRKRELKQLEQELAQPEQNPASA